MYNQRNCINCRNNNFDERSPLLPFLAGVLITTPFIFLNKNNQQLPYPPYPQYPAYPPYPYPSYPQQMPYPQPIPYQQSFYR